MRYFVMNATIIPPWRSTNKVLVITLLRIHRAQILEYLANIETLAHRNTLLVFHCYPVVKDTYSFVLRHATA